ncbi:prepilin peptidase [Longispora albida]|uniref:prepilin peptidase n=1 Tax=Longispora albida TaxID=203523 RepID=UPI00035DD6E4|nr:prepilin peptidase [Longispora albida]
MTCTPATLAGYAILAVLGLALTRADLACRRLPDRLVLPGYLLAGVPLAIGQPAALPRAVAAGLACAAWYGLFCAAGWLGFGDVKLGGLLGLALGFQSWGAVVAGLLASAVLGGLHAALARRPVIPYGPAMLAGNFVILLGSLAQ